VSDAALKTDGDPQQPMFAGRCLDVATLQRMKEVIMFNL
jgi:hypothetical protein